MRSWFDHAIELALVSIGIWSVYVAAAEIIIQLNS